MHYPSYRLSKFGQIEVVNRRKKIVVFFLIFKFCRKENMLSHSLLTVTQVLNKLRLLLSLSNSKCLFEF